MVMGMWNVWTSFFYLGDMMGSGRGAEEASKARVRCAWAKFREQYVQCIMMYGSETWAMKVEDMQRLERAEKMMMRWMCGVTLKDVK